MMRSPRALAVAVRLPDGTLMLRDEPYISLTSRYPLLSLPFLRGPVIFLEALVTGVRALTFSAQAVLEEQEQNLGWGTLILTLGSAFLLAFLFFGFLPHWLTGLLGTLLHYPLTPADFLFHAIDGVIKLGFILFYIWAISWFKDIRRVFQYHGAEHKSICAYEAGEPLEVTHARRHGTCHPRCGTSFLLVVLLVSLFVFTVFFPWFPKLTRLGFVNSLIQVLVKVLLMFPIAAVSYEIIRWGGNHLDRPLARVVLWPGLITQRLTALEPDDAQIEVALAALKAVLAREQTASPDAESGREKAPVSKAALP